MASTTGYAQGDVSGHGDHHPHITPLWIYLTIGGTLLFFTAVTVWVSFIDFGGGWNLIIAMLVATTKASLVAFYFMHLKYDNFFYTIILFSTIIFLAVFIVITMFDTLQRGAINPIRATPVRAQSKLYDNLVAAKPHGAASDSGHGAQKSGEHADSSGATKAAGVHVKDGADTTGIVKDSIGAPKVDQSFPSPHTAPLDSKPASKPADAPKH